MLLTVPVLILFPRETLCRAGLFFIMQKIEFTKPALTISQQIARLTSRGMTINDVSMAHKKLSELNYYRLEGYWLPFESDHKCATFITGSNFSLVLNWYNVDMELRSILFEAISSIEVSFRTKWAYYLSTKYGPFSYLNPQYFHDRKKWLESINKFSADVFRSKENFVKHFIETYKEFFPPEWAAVEVMSLGTLSHLYEYMNEEMPVDSSDLIPAKAAIANDYGLSIKELVSWMRTINVCRNFCAHQSRLIASYLTSQPIAPNSTNPLSHVWCFQYMAKDNISIELLPDGMLKTCTGVEILLSGRSSVGDLPTGLLIYLPDNAIIRNDTGDAYNLPDGTVLLLPIGYKIGVLTNTIFKIPKGSILTFPLSFTPGVSDLEPFCTRTNNLWYNAVISICYMYNKVMGTDAIKEKIRNLLKKNTICSHLLGFPKNWETISYWL
ncbi:Abi family protein [Treponema sp. C6A8]|uniref:Abi family protein n=1 Tax=Treponema sp. C6A8 TaxID=1410609 RepID=UPI001C077F68|nr:Abi family protein [Treponema sp. C6A8]